MMLTLSRFRIIFLLCLLSYLPTGAYDNSQGRELLLEFKGGAFFPTECNFRSIYGPAAFFVSPEFTVQVIEDKNWYIFLSAAYTAKDGYSVGLCTPTQEKLVPFGIGVKYFFQNQDRTFCKNYKFYVGLGFQPTLLRTNNCSDFVQYTSNWGFGGIAKLGCLWNLPRNFFLDFFADYSFVNVGCKNSCNNSSSCSSACPSESYSSGSDCCSSSCNFTVPLKANISGAILGIGIGYRF